MNVQKDNKTTTVESNVTNESFCSDYKPHFNSTEINSVDNSHISIKGIELNSDLHKNKQGVRYIDKSETDQSSKKFDQSSLVEKKCDVPKEEEECEPVVEKQSGYIQCDAEDTRIFKSNLFPFSLNNSTNMLSNILMYPNELHSNKPIISSLMQQPENLSELEGQGPKIDFQQILLQQNNQQQQQQQMQFHQQQFNQQQFLKTQLMYAKLLSPTTYSEPLSDSAFHINDNTFTTHSQQHQKVEDNSIGENDKNNNIFNSTYNENQNPELPTTESLCNKARHLPQIMLSNPVTCTDTEKNHPVLLLLRNQVNTLLQAKLFLEKLLNLTQDFLITAQLPKFAYDSNNLTDTVRKGLCLNDDSINYMIANIKQLILQCENANLYYMRSIQRLQQTKEQFSHCNISSVATAAMATALKLYPPLSVRSATGICSSESGKNSESENARSNSFVQQKVFSKNFDGEALNLDSSLKEIEDNILKFVSDTKSFGHSVDDDNNKSIESECKEMKYERNSPNCFWHPKFIDKEHSVTAAEIILECAALTTQGNIKDTDAAVIALKSAIGTVQNAVGNKMYENKVQIKENKLFSSLKKSKKGLPTNILPNSSAPITTVKNNGIVESMITSTPSKHRRKSNIARRINTTTATMTASDSSTSAISNATSALVNKVSQINPYNSHVFSSTATIPTLSNVSTHIESKYSSNATILTTTKSLSNAVTTSTEKSPPPATMSSPTVTAPATSAVATVAAFHGRTFTDIFKAQFNALTAAAVVMNAAAIGNSCPSDMPFDLSIGSKLKQT
ncbi:protein pangolin-like [Teleopsis dalmanni]|uniref:protein pangolin-like n=1 Tax=Teleopsis dalmanni TaxID=139649 RepID=UPI0018CE9F36|nr:protein pangolin-like [Teleopsis dalmanni]